MVQVGMTGSIRSMSVAVELALLRTPALGRVVDDAEELLMQPEGALLRPANGFPYAELCVVLSLAI
jgi:hypothetical protein